MKKYLLGLVFIILLVVPAFAYVYEETAPADKAFNIIYIQSDGGTTGTIEMYQQNGDMTVGYWLYEDWSFLTFPPGADASITIGADSATTHYTTPGKLWAWFRVWRPIDFNSTTSTVIRGDIGQTQYIPNEGASVVVKNYPIVRYRITSNQPVVVDARLIPITVATANANSFEDSNLISLLTSYISLIVMVFSSLIYWIKFIFVDNLVLSVSLYVAGSMAYAINTSRDIFSFYKTWFRQQRALFEFMAAAFATTFQIVTQVAAIVGKIAGSAAALITAIILKLV